MPLRPSFLSHESDTFCQRAVDRHLSLRRKLWDLEGPSFGRPGQLPGHSPEGPLIDPTRAKHAGSMLALVSFLSPLALVIGRALTIVGSFDDRTGVTSATVNCHPLDQLRNQRRPLTGLFSTDDRSPRWPTTNLSWLTWLLSAGPRVPAHRSHRLSHGSATLQGRPLASLIRAGLPARNLK